MAQILLLKSCISYADWYTEVHRANQNQDSEKCVKGIVVKDIVELFTSTADK